MRYPKMTVNSEKILSNALIVNDICQKHGILALGVTSGMAGDPRLAEIYAEAGFAGVCDGKLSSLARIKNTPGKCSSLPRRLARPAAPSELAELPNVADSSFQSDVSTILSLDEICLKSGSIHDVLLLIDIGDLGDGFISKELNSLPSSLEGLGGGVRIIGVAAAFAVASGVLPSAKNMSELVSYRDALQEGFGFGLPKVSVGGTPCLKLIEAGLVPDAVNEFRIGEGVVLGVDRASDRAFDFLDGSAVTVSAEITECRHKPSVPYGELGMPAYGYRSIFIDRGMRKRAVLAMGWQDTDIYSLDPVREDVHVLTASSDRTIVDVTEADSFRNPEESFKPGDIVEFKPSYSAMLAAASSQDVLVNFV
jgi:predicted amino acid racemase